MKKRVLGCVIMIGMLTGCMSNPINYTNSLYTDEKQISAENNTYSLDYVEQEVEDNQYIGKMRFEGADTIWQYRAPEDCDIEVSYRLSVTSGKAKLVLISPNKAITTLAENEDQHLQEETLTITLELQKGMNRIRLVGADNANIKLRLEVPVGTLNEVGA